jgi:hypothetical protein
MLRRKRAATSARSVKTIASGCIAGDHLRTGLTDLDERADMPEVGIGMPSDSPSRGSVSDTRRPAGKQATQYYLTCLADQIASEAF